MKKKGEFDVNVFSYVHEFNISVLFFYHNEIRISENTEHQNCSHSFPIKMKSELR